MQDTNHVIYPNQLEPEIHLGYMFEVLRKNFSKLLLAFIAGAVCASGYALWKPNVYTSSVRFLPSASGGNSSVAALAAGVPDFALSAAGLNMQNQGDLYKGLLDSRVIQDAVIEKHQLQTYYEQEFHEKTREELSKKTKVDNGTDGIMLLSVEDYSPEKAQEIASTYYQELEKLTANLALTSAQKKRVFFAQQLDDAKLNLAQAEESMQRFQVESGAVALPEQAKVAVEQLAQLRAQISAKKIQIQSMRSFAAETNPDLKKARFELVALNTELQRLESSSQLGSKEGSTLLATSDLASTGTDYARQLRNLKHAEAMYAMMTKQFEAAKLAEAEEGGNNLQLIDVANLPELKSGPKRALITALGAIFASMLMMAYILFKTRDDWLIQPAQVHHT